MTHVVVRQQSSATAAARMAILVKDFTWRQSDAMVIVRVPLKGVHCSKVDVFTFDNYIKAHYRPFLFELFLFSKINESESKCTLAEEDIIFELKKSESGIWDHLEADLSKSEKKELRQEILTKYQEKSKEDRSARADKKQELQREAVREQIALDSKHRKMIEEKKELVKSTAVKDLTEWTATLKEVDEEERESESIETKEDTPELTENLEELKIWKASVTEKEAGHDHVIIKTKSAKAKASKAAKDKNIFHLEKFGKIRDDPTPRPFPRETGKIVISFTPRVFPTPSRESRLAEEEEWLKKQAELRRMTGFVAEDLTPEEQNPLWLKDKGDSFYKAGNYLGAISAYSHAINTLGSEMPALFSNRAAAHLAKGNLHKTVEDSSKALELLTPCVPSNAKSRARCHIRRGTALCLLGMAEHGLPDLEAALSLEQNNCRLKSDIDKVRSILDSKTMSKLNEIQIEPADLE